MGLQPEAGHHELHDHHSRRRRTDAADPRPPAGDPRPSTYDAWLDPATPATEVKLLLARNLDSDLQFQRVSRTVNSVTQQKSPDLPGFCRRLWTSLDRLKRKFGAQKKRQTIGLHRPRAFQAPLKQPGGGTTSKALHRFVGSIAFTAAARMAFAVMEDSDEANRRLLLHVKNNLAAPPQGIAFTVVQRLVEVSGGSVVQPYVVWDPNPVTMTANEAMAADAGGAKPAQDDAAEFLQELLADGPVPQKRVKEDADGAGLSWATVRRAKDRLGVKAVRDTVAGEFGTGKGQWLWSLKVLTEAQDAHIKRLSTLSGNEHLKAKGDVRDRPDRLSADELDAFLRSTQ